MAKERWFILFYCCIIAFSVDFFYDEPSALVARLTGTSVYCVNGTDTSCLELDMVQYNAFFSGISWASGVAALVAGLCIDHYGPVTPLWFSIALIFAGALLFAGGSYASSTTVAFGLMLAGRVIHGIGGGTVVTVCHQMKAAWFHYDELALSFGLHILCARLGSAAAYAIIGTAVTTLGLSGSLWIGFGVTLLACIAIVGLINRDHRIHDSGIPSSMSGAGHSFRRLNGLFWCLVIVAFLLYGVVSTFTANGVALITDIYGRSESVSSLIVDLIYDICLITPFLAIFMDKFGHRDWWITASSLFLIIGLGLFLAPRCPPWVIPVFFGLSYAIFPTTLYSSLPLVVPQRSLGIANGVLTFVQYASTGILTLGAGAILDMLPSDDNRRWLRFTIFLAGIAVLAILLAFIINCLNAKTGRRLTPSQKVRRQAVDIEEVTPINIDFVTEPHGSVVRETTEIRKSETSMPASWRSFPSRQEVRVTSDF
ncbi:major facilitator superfamily domain-containing protein 1-like [Paramacrobiotus metropolitanus]|uniref:major facilitator superfamily domain-containing protein 1-like n=1 Tax=Paramacrobiotus metropolitanus TaxID=2943436 RepID=UPI002446208B|nr:major facilitator superfamily domain-containing protein 1-like [Paramacrobiotus metropolitanus]